MYRWKDLQDILSFEKCQFWKEYNDTYNLPILSALQTRKTVYIFYKYTSMNIDAKKNIWKKTYFMRREITSRQGRKGTKIGIVLLFIMF